MAQKNNRPTKAKRNIVRYTVKFDDGTSKGAKGTVNFNPKPKNWEDICISTNCGTPRRKPSMKNQHDPRFHPKPKIKVKIDRRA